MSEDLADRATGATYRYAVDVDEHPQSVAFDSWHGDAPALPEAFPTWAGFWASAESSH